MSSAIGAGLPGMVLNAGIFRLPRHGDVCKAGFCIDLTRIVMTTRKAPPWKKPNPVKRTQTTHLTAEQKQQAKARAAAAGRRYPNLIDNMAVARAVKRARPMK